jgi:hypothetical protein
MYFMTSADAYHNHLLRSEFGRTKTERAHANALTAAVRFLKKPR